MSEIRPAAKLLLVDVVSVVSKAYKWVNSPNITKPSFFNEQHISPKAPVTDFFMKWICTFVKDHNPSGLVFVIDQGWNPKNQVYDSKFETMTYRKEINPKYKNWKDNTLPADLSSMQYEIDVIRLLLTNLGLIVTQCIEYETKDYFATIIKSNPEYEFVIVSDDNDNWQLISRNVSTIFTMSRKFQFFGPNDFEHRFGFNNPLKLPVFKAIAGDKFNNYEPIKDQREADALLFIRRFPDFDLNDKSTYRGAENMKVGEAIIYNIKAFADNLKLSTLVTNVNLAEYDFEFVFSDNIIDEFKQNAAKLKLKSQNEIISTLKNLSK